MEDSIKHFQDDGYNVPSNDDYDQPSIKHFQD